VGKRRRRESVDLLNDTPGGDGAPVPNGQTVADHNNTDIEPAMRSVAGTVPMSSRHSVSSAGGTDYTRTTGTGLFSRGGAQSPQLPRLSFGDNSLSSHAGADQSHTPGGRDRTHPPSAFFNSGNGGRPTTPTTSEGTSVQSPLTSSKDRKSVVPPALRTVNFIQHDDAGEIPQPSGSVPPPEEVVELPPSYVDVQSKKTGAAA